MEILSNGFTLNTPAGTFPLSSDSILLADFARLPKNASILDLGSGCGTLGLLLCAKDPLCHVTGIEMDPLAHKAAQDNICRNCLSERIESICVDLRTLPSSRCPGQFDCCISNPPYFSSGASSQSLPLARQDSSCSMEDLFKSAAWHLKFGGDFFLVHKPERLAELITQANNHRLALKRLRLVRHRPGGDISLILLSFRKGAKPGLNWEELCLYDANGMPSDEYRRIYHL